MARRTPRRRYLYLLLDEPVPAGFFGDKFDSVGDAIEPVPLVRDIDNAAIRVFPDVVDQIQKHSPVGMVKPFKGLIQNQHGR
jgi:hypothetical protein